MLRWSAEKEKQDQIQRAKTLKRQSVKKAEPNPADSEPMYENQAGSEQPLYENPGMLLPQPAMFNNSTAVKPKSNTAAVTIPNPLIANISNTILTPLPSSSVNGGSASDGVTKRQNSKPDNATNDIDLAWFEKEDDPFDNLERQTINDMEELASVLNETNVNANLPQVSETPTNDPVTVSGQSETNDPGDSDNSDDPMYENVELRAMDLMVKTTEPVTDTSDQTESKQMFDMNYLPPVPARRDLIGKGAPLPPIRGLESDGCSSPVYANSVTAVNGNATEQSTVNVDTSGSTNTNVTKKPEPSFQEYENVNSDISKPPVIRPPPPKPAKPSRYSRHDLDDKTADSDPVYDNHKSVAINAANSHVKFTNSSPAAGSDDQTSKGTELNFVSSHFGANNGQAPPGSAPGQKDSPVPPPRPDRPPSRPASNQVGSLVAY